MIIQIFTPNGTLELNTAVNTAEDFVQYGLDIKDYQKQGFDVGLFFQRFSEEFTAGERINLSQIAPNLMFNIQFKYFSEVKIILDYLLSTAAITQDMLDKISALFLEQEIDLIIF
jgi:hypothetical protein